MHELSICLDLVRQLDEVASRHGATRVTRAVVRIGPLSGIEPAQLADAFVIARAGTVAVGAELEIDHAPLEIRCRSCGGAGRATPNRLLCPACGDWRVDVLSGTEMILASVELEDAKGD